MVVKAARSGVNPATLSIKSVLYNHDLLHLCGTSRFGGDEYLDNAFANRGYSCDHPIDEQHLEDPFALALRCADCRASFSVSCQSGTKQNTTKGNILSAAILATCQTIATEAMSILYCKHTIEIDLGSCSVGRRCDPSERDIQRLCGNIFIINPDSDLQMSLFPSVPRSSSLSSTPSILSTQRGSHPFRSPVQMQAVSQIAFQPSLALLSSTSAISNN